jgi:hypothetical protein
MKFTSFLILTTSLFFISCSSDDQVIQTPISTEGNDIPTIYHPIKIAYYWNYETENIPVEPTGTTVTGADKLLVDSDVVLNTLTYKKMKTEFAPTGFYGGMLNNNNLRIDGSSLKLTGEITANLDASLPLEFDVNDFVIFKENGVANEVLSQTSPASFENTTLIVETPLTFTYSIKSTCLGDVAPMLVKGVTYNNVKKTRIEIELKITTFISGVEAIILQSQPVIVSNQFYAKNIGVIQANTVVKYSVDTTYPFLVQAVTNAGIPPNGEQKINDYLSSYLTN